LETPPKNIASASLGWRHVWYYVEYYAWAYIYFFYVFVWAIGYPDKMSVLDENQKIVTISPKELKSLAVQMVKYAKKIRAQEEEKALEK
jgi:hypothetical protein